MPHKSLIQIVFFRRRRDALFFRLHPGSGVRWDYSRDDGVGELLSITRADNAMHERWSHSGGRLPGHKLFKVTLSGVETFTLQYDGRQRVTHDGAFDHTFDIFDRLIHSEDALDPNTFEVYLYDAQGRLVYVEDAAREEVLIYDGAHKVASYQNNQLAWEARWGAQLDQLVEWRHMHPTQGSTSYIPLRDHRHNIIALWNTVTRELTDLSDFSSQGLLTRRAYDETVTCQEEGATRCTLALQDVFPFGFNSAWRSSTTHLYQMRHRWYSPQLGEFISHDPLEYIDSFNMYAFAAHDPINSWDPWGLDGRDLVKESGGDVEMYDRLSENEKDKVREEGRRYKKWKDQKDRQEELYNEVANGGSGPAINNPPAPRYIDWDDIGRGIASLNPLSWDGHNGATPTVPDHLTPKTTEGKLVGSLPLPGIRGIRPSRTPKRNKSSSGKEQKCAGGKCSNKNKCFVAGTLVLLGTGLSTPIESMEVGDVVSIEAGLGESSGDYGVFQDTEVYGGEGIRLVLKNGRVESVYENGVKNPVSWRDVLGSRYMPGSLDATDVTPLLWRRLGLEMTNESGEFASIELIRPIWWIEEHGVVDGEPLKIEMSELGQTWQGYVVSYTADVKQDSRHLTNYEAIVTGTIAHQSSEVLDLVIEHEDTIELLGVTVNHPLFSLDREQFIDAGELHPGERLASRNASPTMIQSMGLRIGAEPVYNIEVHRAHNYYVSNHRVLAHNTNFQCGDVTDGGLTLTDHAAGRANKRGFSLKNIDDIVNHQKRPERQLIDGEVRFKYKDNRGNIVVLDESKSKVISLFNDYGDGNYVPRRDK